MLRIINDANTSITDDRLTVYRITNFERQLVTWEFGLMDTSWKVKRRKDLINAVIVGVQNQNDALNVVTVLFQKSSDRPCNYIYIALAFLCNRGRVLRDVTFKCTV